MMAFPFLGLFPSDAADAFRQKERLGRGVNIIGWLPCLECLSQAGL